MPPDHRSGLESVYLSKRQALIAFLRARGAGERAEDLVQELWVRISGSPSGPIADPVNYLFQSANNLMISFHRSLTQATHRDLAWAELFSPSPDQTEAQAFDRDAILRAEARLRSLGERAYAMFVMYRVEGRTQREIAAHLGVSLSTVEKQLRQAFVVIAAFRDEADADS